MNLLDKCAKHFRIMMGINKCDLGHFINFRVIVCEHYGHSTEGRSEHSSESEQSILVKYSTVVLRLIALADTAEDSKCLSWRVFQVFDERSWVFLFDATTCLVIF